MSVEYPNHQLQKPFLNTFIFKVPTFPLVAKILYQIHIDKNNVDVITNAPTENKIKNIATIRNNWKIMGERATQA